MSFSDLAARYATSLQTFSPILIVSTTALAVIALRPVRLRGEHARRWFAWTFAALAIIWAAALSWIGDDAFISFRYARNLAEGHGLVFNLGEKVEGYTNFLWTVLFAPLIKLGLDPAQTSIVMSIACYLGVIALTWRFLSPRARPADTIPLAPIVLAASYVFASYATSGLETMFGALLVVAAFSAARAERPLLAGALGIAATMAHPDHAIFYAGLGLTLMIHRRRIAPLVLYALPFALVFVPYYAWRTHYYGDFFPNTYYAKSGDLWYAEQGVRYLLINIVAAGLTLCLPLALVQAFRERRTWLGTYALIVLPVYFTYLVKIGGDFMFGRLLVPVLPFVFVLVASALDAAKELKHRLRVAVAILALGLATVPNGVIEAGEIYEHVADERTFYRLRSFAPIRLGNSLFRLANSLREVFSESTREPRIATGNVGILGYYTGFPLIDDFGLTDPVVAQMELAERGRTGHEKLSSPGNIVAQDADLSVLRVYPRPFDALTTAKITDMRYALAKYDRPFIDSWKMHADVEVVDFVGFLDRFSASSNRKRRECQLWFLEQYYFAHNDDPSRLQRVRNDFVAKESSWAPLEELLLVGEPPDDRWRPIPVEDFDTHRLDWAPTGTAFSATDRKSPGQGFIYGQSKRFASSYARADGDAAVGDWLSSPFTVTGEAITFQLGGGQSPKVRIELVHDGDVVRRAWGCNSEIMGRRIWNVESLKGKDVRLRLIDASTKSWGHLLVDTIAQWQRR